MKIHDEIPHWLCVDCASIQPWEGEGSYPVECWSCKGSNFIKDSLPALHTKDKR